jgi:peptide/nickel transport system permease protein
MSQELTQEDEGIGSRIRSNPRPALLWVVGALALLALEFGAIVNLVTTTLPWTGGIKLPTLLSRELIPNQGYQLPSGSWQGTFLGLSPAVAWTLRVVLIYTYAFAWVAWIWYGYLTFRRNYRFANWTPTDDRIDRLRDHRWGQFGFVVVFTFVMFAVFAPALGPTTVQQNLENPAGHSIKYWDAEAGARDEITVFSANSRSRSVGPSGNVGPMSYDDYGRFHPFGTLPSGKDLFTFLVAGARISLIIGLLAVSLSSTIALVGALTSAYFKGRVDLGMVLLSDAVMSLPQLLLLIMLTVVLANTWVGNLYDGAFVLALIFAGTGWPYLWRSLRGPALQVSEREWIDAARSFGQSPVAIMRKHMLPYIVGYLLVYGSMSLGGAIIAIAGLSFLGLGVNPPTPEWGRAVDAGQDYVATQSWHISFIPGALITLVVTGFNALGDGVRDAIDPESESAGGEAAGRGGGA